LFPLLVITTLLACTAGERGEEKLLVPAPVITGMPKTAQHHQYGDPLEREIAP
jgi:hypothetical protein